MDQIKLPNGVWSYDREKPLGAPGGFGAVFSGSDSDGNAVAVKRLHLGAADAAHRELRIASELTNRDLQHVMPVLDAGQDADSEAYFVVMPVAKRSLQDLLRHEGPLPESAAADVLSQIAKGLAEVPDIVHRDLKPANVLFLNGRWHIADFGIARFVEESTSLRTLKDCLSPHFAAPEQWASEHATSATDVYALGCIAFTLLAGAPPFDGSPAELRDKHLHAAPPEFSGCTPQMRTLIGMMLRKTPAARPSLARVSAVLENIKRSATTPAPTAALDRLAAAAAAHEARQAQAAAEAERIRSVEANRTALAAEARRVLVGIFEELARRISESVPSAVLRTDTFSRSIDVGSASLEFDFGVPQESLKSLGDMDGVVRPDPQRVLHERDFPRSHWDVICGAAIEVTQKSPAHKRAASLWYTRRSDKRADYRWYEVGYEGNPVTGQAFQFQPAAVTPDLADRAHSTAMDVVQASYSPVAIDDEDLDAFCERWTHILAEASAGRLQQMPTSLPSVR